MGRAVRGRPSKGGSPRQSQGFQKSFQDGQGRAGWGFQGDGKPSKGDLQGFQKMPPWLALIGIGWIWEALGSFGLSPAWLLLALVGPCWLWLAVAGLWMDSSMLIFDDSWMPLVDSYLALLSLPLPSLTIACNS